MVHGTLPLFSRPVYRHSVPSSVSCPLLRLRSSLSFTIGPVFLPPPFRLSLPRSLARTLARPPALLSPLSLFHQRSLSSSSPRPLPLSLVRAHSSTRCTLRMPTRIAHHWLFLLVSFTRRPPLRYDNRFLSLPPSSLARPLPRTRRPSRRALSPSRSVSLHLSAAGRGRVTSLPFAPRRAKPSRALFSPSSTRLDFAAPPVERSSNSMTCREIKFVLAAPSPNRAVPGLAVRGDRSR